MFRAKQPTRRRPATALAAILLVGLLPTTVMAADPTAVDDDYTVPVDASVTSLDVLANDTDPDGGDVLTITIVTDPPNGTASIVGNAVEYTPDSAYHGTDTFDYTIEDVAMGTSTATVAVSVNTAPDAVDDDLSVAIDDPATAAPVLDNDSDVDDDGLTIVSNSDPIKGVVVITGVGTGLTYEPDLGSFGEDSFTYTISDGQGGFATATVAVSIGLHAANDAGLTVPESAGATVLDVLANDFPQDGSLTIIANTNGAHGGVAITGGGTGLTYNPDQLYKGKDVFTYTISDGIGGTDTAAVLLTVVKDTAAPVAVAAVASFPKQTVGTKTTKVLATWSGTDTGGTGVASYKLQVQANGGSWVTVSASTKSTSAKYTLTNRKTYRFRVRATDKEGNTSSYAYGPTFKATRYQDTSSAVAYTGSWSKARPSGALGSHSYTSSTSKRVSLTTTMVDIAWIATRTPKGGKVEVWIDGVLAATKDLDAKNAKYRKLVFHRHFSSLASHTIELRPAGGGRTYLDAFIVLR